MGASEWPVFPATPIIEMRKPDWATIASYSDATSIEFRNMNPAQAPRLAEIGFLNLRALSLRHLRATNLQVLVHFPQLKRFRVWQSNPV